LALNPAAAADLDSVPFGADVSVGLAGGVLLGEWPVPGPHGALTVRYDAFIQDRETLGPRLGLSIFATGSVWPLQDKQEEIDGVVQLDGEFRWLHYGALMALRYDPAAPRAATFGLGFSRLDVEDWYDGVQAVPMVIAELGYRQRAANSWAFVDAHLRAGWGNARGADGSYTDWWLVQAVVAGGFHVR
jgi:hypothetical protein